jgi:NADPH-dependent glutamate synthase beta subunit-like oxidoreductase
MAGMEQQELRELERQCIQEHAPACTAVCPIHVDVRAIMGALSRGDFAEAAKILRRTVPFPRIVSRVCDHPCQAACRRREAGEAISIRALEKACLDWAVPGKERFLPLPKKDQAVAVVGGGLSGLTAAFDLAGKGYRVTVFEARNQLGGSLWDFSEKELPRAIMANDFRVLEESGVEVRTGSIVEKDLYLTEAIHGFDAFYLAPGRQPPETLGLALNEQGQIQTDPVTLATSREGVFAGGGLRRGPAERSPIRSMADGRIAAISIDRYLQKVSLTAVRLNEGPYTTRLYTSTEGVERLQAVSMESPEQGYSADEAMREAGRCIQCQCLECVKVCEYLKSFGGYPKKYVREIYNNLSIVMGMRHANKLINSCSLCGLCREVCPEDLDMGVVCRKAREIMVAAGKMPLSPHEFPIRDMLFSNSKKCSLVRHQPGETTSRFVFFPGCQLSASAPAHVRKAYTLLTEKLAGGVGLMLACCGAPADWSGRSELFRTTLQAFKEQWENMGSPELILACSTCYETIKTHLKGASVVSLWEVMDRLGLPEGPTAVNASTVAVLDACTTRHEESIHRSVRSILNRCGFKVEELALSRDRTECCGYGGLMFFANRELAEKVIRRRIEASPVDYVAYCAMCRDYFASRGKRTLHLLDIVLGPVVDEPATRRGPGYSERHENRVRLKRKLLKELWSESVAEKSGQETIRLSISPRVWELMENRLILEEDVQAVIHFAESSGARLLDPQSGRTIAHFRPENVTYWVEYSPEGDGYVIHNVYSHRMEVAEEAKP